MKKNYWICFGVLIFAFAFIGLAWLIMYINDNYDLVKYLWIFNFLMIFSIPLYYSIHNNIEKRKKKKIESTIIKEIDFEYYREIIKEYSPATLSFLLDGTELKKDFTASIIYLVNKGYFKLTEYNKLERTDKPCDELPEDLQIICNNPENMLYIPKAQFEENETQSLLKKQWFDSIENISIKKGLVIERKDWKILSFTIIICIIEFFSSLYIDNIGLTITSVIVAVILIFTKFWAFDENKWIKTQKGYELYTKIIGLKNYIKDYSMLSDSELKEIAIWDDYLIYAIIFNDTSKLNKEVMEFYKKLCNAM